MRKGWYRIKLKPQEVGESTYTFFVNGLASLECKIITKKFCDDFRLIKFLDKNGKYRFYPFASNWQRVNKSTQIGEVSNFITSLRNGQSDMRNIGYKNTQSISLTAEQLTDDEILTLEDLYVSPSIYLYSGNGTTDLMSDWVLVTIKGDGIGRSNKKGLKKITIEVSLPDSNTITL